MERVEDQTSRAETAVRPKASKRKGRSEVVEHKARRPTQDRSVKRFNAILSATEELLQTSNIEDISLLDVARQAGVSPPSVHYFFPTMAALQIELSRIYNKQATDPVLDVQGRLAAMKNPTWQEWIRLMAHLSCKAFNDNRHICETIFGAALHRESRLVMMAANDLIGRSMLENLKQVFLVPEIPNLDQKFAFTCEIVDALWARAYLRHGVIDEATVEETVRIQIAYLRSFLPETLPLGAHESAPT